ncbi:MAG: glycosyltransferase family 4 protein, partial [Janthinobacterium lividum]
FLDRRGGSGEMPVVLRREPGTRVKILIAHNRYRQAGGEDAVVAAEAAMLRRQGHEVELLLFDNEAISGVRASAAAAIASFYSLPGYRQTAKMLAGFAPAVLHVHNFMPTLSPAVFFAAGAARIPVVQTLHNYRLLCANAQLFRDGSVCERCVEQRSFLPGVRLACYRGSRAGSAVVGGTMALHHALGTWSRRVARYIALSEFAAAKLGTFRVPRDRIRIKPNFVPDRGAAAAVAVPSGEHPQPFALFVGRLSEEKGLATLIAADEQARLPMPVKIAGDGPWRERVERAAQQPGSHLVYLGRQSEHEILALMQRAEVLLVPSLWYEGFPMVMVEALSLGLPVIASRLGGLPEIVEEGVCGLLHSPGDPEALAQMIQAFLNKPAEAKLAMRRAARQRYLDLYGEQRNYETLMKIYAEALEPMPRA